MDDGEVPRGWRKAPVAPFFVLRFAWRAVDRDDPCIVMEGNSWMGWMAGEPKAGWSGVVGELLSMAPVGACMEVGAVESDRRPQATLDMLAPVRAPGAASLWIGSEEAVHQDMSSPRIGVLDVVARFDSEEIPRVWSPDWDRQMQERALGPVKAMAERMLAGRAFADVEFMGRHGDICGDLCWSNMAWAMWPAWEARVQARQIESAVAPGSGSKPRQTL